MFGPDVPLAIVSPLLEFGAIVLFSISGGWKGGTYGPPAVNAAFLSWLLPSSTQDFHGVSTVLLLLRSPIETCGPSFLPQAISPFPHFCTSEGMSHLLRWPHHQKILIRAM